MLSILKLAIGLSPLRQFSNESHLRFFVLITLTITRRLPKRARRIIRRNTAAWKNIELIGEELEEKEKARKDEEDEEKEEKGLHHSKDEQPYWGHIQDEEDE